MSGARVEHVVQPRGWPVSADTIDVTYDLPAVLGGHVKSATLSGMVVDLRLPEKQRAEPQRPNELPLLVWIAVASTPVRVVGARSRRIRRACQTREFVCADPRR